MLRFFLKTGLCLDFRSHVFYFQFKPFKVNFSKYSVMVSVPEEGGFSSHLEPEYKGGPSVPSGSGQVKARLEYLSESQNE